MVNIVEVHQDGSEEHISQCMDTESEPPVVSTPPAEVETPKPLVKLLTCQPLGPPQPPPKLMLWVDGCLAPALQPPLYIDVETANAIAKASTGEGGGSGAAAAAAATPAAASAAPPAEGAASASASALPTSMDDAHGPPTPVMDEEVADATATAPGSAARRLRHAQSGGRDSRLNEDARGGSRCAGSRGGSRGEISPPVLSKRTRPLELSPRPASAIGAAGYGPGGWATTGGCSSCSRSASAAGGADGGLGGLRAGWQSPGPVGNLSESLGDCQLESPAKVARPTLSIHLPRPSSLELPLDSPLGPLGGPLGGGPSCSRGRKPPPPTPPPSARAGTEPRFSPATFGLALASTREVGSPSAEAEAAFASPSAPHTTRYRRPAAPSAAAARAGGLLKKSTPLAPSAQADGGARAECARAGGIPADDRPAAPPPSPVGSRPPPCNVFGSSKRKARESGGGDLPSMIRVASELDAMKIEPRPSKWLRAGRSISVPSGDAE